MKKIIMLLLAGIIMLPAAVNANAQSKAMNKALKKEYKTKMKEFNKEGWKLFGSARSLDVALLQHYDKLNAEGSFEVVGVASRFKSKNVGHQTAINNASNTYARQAGSHVKGRIVSDMAGNADDTSTEFDHFYAAYETLVEKEIKGELKESFSVIRDLGNGEYEMQAFFVVDENAATQARVRAMENALRESEAAQRYAKKVSEFVQEGFAMEM